MLRSGWRVKLSNETECRRLGQKYALDYRGGGISGGFAGAAAKSLALGGGAPGGERLVHRGHAVLPGQRGDGEKHRKVDVIIFRVRPLKR